jgi:hypothetical protein
MTPEEKMELAELLHYRTLDDFDRRALRLRAAEERLGMWENGKFTGLGLAEIIGNARSAPRRFSRDEFIVANLGFSSPEELIAAKAAARERRNRASA